ncbi:alpha/beta hydrolase [Planosporangium thailandense]|uniref:Alpha/beta hydrolase n=1 Tax=Planosporangium thailandense TaxID=765197 RepID=A0ABX0Y4L1_9ACTN|nr:alpha/beta hydrolase [Planosporangium thailandense]NJC73072.1 alpha/beta hydrolase [Planosporangium thailandense]
MPLHTVAQQVLDALAASGRPNAHLLPVEIARANFEADYAALARVPVAGVRNLVIPTRDGGTIPARLYLPHESAGLPLVVYFHGGGWLLGSIDSHDVVTRKLARAAGCAVLSVGYRRGPEARFPAAVHDAVDAVRWSVSAADELGVDASRLAVAGDSAGGNLATVAAAVLRDDGDHSITFQLLVYPVTTCDLTVGFDMAYEGHLLYRDEMQWHQDNYLSRPEDRYDPRVSPLLGNLAGLPPTAVVLAECDPIRPQGVAYAQALRRAGVPVVVYESEALMHGFFGLDEVFSEADQAMIFAGQQLSAAFGAA